MGDAETDKNVIGIAVIGIGRIGKVHVSNIVRLPRVQLLYIIDVCKEAAEEYILEYNLSARALHSDEVNEAYKDDRLHAVIVGCPTQSHETHVKMALSKGKAVFCEKPLSFSLDTIAECYELAEAKGKPLFCAFNRRFDPQTASVRCRIPESVGKIKVVKTVSRDHPRNTIDYLKISGGIMIDSCIHDIDMLLWMAGESPSTIHAIGHAHFDDIREIGDVDQLFVTMKFPSGALGHIDLCREASYGHDQRIEVFGSKGMLCSQNPYPETYEVHSASGKAVPPIYASCMTRYNESYRHEMMHFVDAVRGAAKLSVTGRDTMCTTLCCHAANESLATGNPVNLKEFVARKFPKLMQLLDSTECVNGKHE